MRRIDYKWFLFGTIFLFWIIEILGLFEDGYSVIAIIAGWLIGILTVSQWEIEKEERNANKKRETT